MRFLSLFLLFFSFSCVPSKEVGETSSGNINKNAPYIWDDHAFPKAIRISSNFNANEEANILEMGDAWSDAVDDKVTFFAFGTRTPEITNSLSNMDSMYDGVLGIYKTEQWPQSLQDSAASALAVTQIFGRRHNTGRSNEFVSIEHADILINYDEFDFDTGNSGFGYDLRTVILHEMGHFLGLQHKNLSWFDKDDSVMYPSISSSEAKRYPRNLDIGDIASKYNINLGGGAGHSIAAKRNVYKADPREVGQEVKILIELRADGECVHKVDGEIVGGHRVDVSKLRE